MIKIHSLNVRASIATISLVLSGAAVGLSTPVFAQATDLTPAQVAQVQATLAQALAAVPQGLTGAALQSAQTAAIAQTEEAEVGTLGASAAGSITDAVLSAPALTNVSPNVVGQALGTASAVINTTSGTAAAAAIGTAVANEGPTGSQVAFSGAAIASGAPVAVASAAVASPVVTGATGAAGATGATTPLGTTGAVSSASASATGTGATTTAAAAPPPPCAGPSCS